MLYHNSSKIKKGWAIIFSMFYGILIMCCILFSFKIQLNTLEESQLYCNGINNCKCKDTESEYVKTYFYKYLNHVKFSSTEESKKYLVENEKKICFYKGNSKLYYNSQEDEFYMESTLKSKDVERFIYKYQLKDGEIKLLFYRREYF